MHLVLARLSHAIRELLARWSVPNAIVRLLLTLSMHPVPRLCRCRCRPLCVVLLVWLTVLSVKLELLSWACSERQLRPLLIVRKQLLKLVGGVGAIQPTVLLTARGLKCSTLMFPSILTCLQCLTGVRQQSVPLLQGVQSVGTLLLSSSIPADCAGPRFWTLTPGCRLKFLLLCMPMLSIPCRVLGIDSACVECSILVLSIRVSLGRLCCVSVLLIILMWGSLGGSGLVRGVVIIAVGDSKEVTVKVRSLGMGDGVG